MGLANRNGVCPGMTLVRLSTNAVDWLGANVISPAALAYAGITGPVAAFAGLFTAGFAPDAVGPVTGIFTVAFGFH